MDSIRQRDLVMGVILFLLALAAFALTFHFSGSDFEEIAHDPGPKFLPRILLLALIMQSVFLVYKSAARNNEPADRSAPKPEPITQIRPLVMLAAFLAYVYLATCFGYVAATICFLGLSFYILGVKKIYLLLALPLAITAATYYLFEILLDVYLPSGSLF